MVDVVDVPVPSLPVSARLAGFEAGCDFDRRPEVAREAAQEMILGHLPMVESIARRVHGTLPANARIELHDLAQSGLLGLVTAGRHYNPAAAVPFSIYARYRVEGEILDSLRRQDFAPRKLRRWQKQVSAARRELVAALSREPTEEELCDRLMVSMAEMRSRNLALSHATPVPHTARPGEEPSDPATSPDTHPDHICSRRELRKMLDRLIERLPARHKQVIRLHYGRHMTMKEIGNDMSVNESRVSQMHRSALQAMGRRLRESGISSPADV